MFGDGANIVPLQAMGASVDTSLSLPEQAHDSTRTDLANAIPPKKLHFENDCAEIANGPIQEQILSH